MAIFLTIGSQIVNHMASNSGIFCGENVQQGWSTTVKSNTSVFFSGQFSALINNINLVSDPDFIDFPTNEPNVDATTAPVILKCI